MRPTLGGKASFRSSPRRDNVRPSERAFDERGDGESRATLATLVMHDRQRWAILAASLVAAASSCAHARRTERVGESAAAISDAARARVLHRRAFGAGGDFDIAFTEREMFVATPEGLFNAALDGSTDLVHIAGFDRPLTSVVADGARLYLTASSSGNVEGSWTSLARYDPASGETTRLDAGLQACAQGRCAPIGVSDIAIGKGVIVANAGGGRNLFASPDRGQTWIALKGTLSRQVCSPGAVALVSDVLITGGECPLDDAYLERGELTADGRRFAKPLAPARTPDLENRMIRIVRPVAGAVFAGAEGAILKSADDGRSWQPVLHCTQGDTKYPYVSHFASANEGRIVAAGFDKARGKAFGAASDDGGASWGRLKDAEVERADDVVFAKETRSGAVIVGLWTESSRELVIAELPESPLAPRTGLCP